MTIAKGFSSVVAFKKNTNTWGSGAAVQAGAGDGIEILSESLTADSMLIENEQVSGEAVQLPGVKGNILHAGDLQQDFYYQGCEVMLAMAFGTAEAAVQQGGTAAYLHVYKIAGNHEGIAGTLVLDNDVAIREYPFVKVGGVTMEWTEGDKGKLTFPLVPFDLNLNVGSPVANRIVASVEPANGALVIANQPAQPSPLSVLVTDANTSITELIITFVGTDRDGNVITEVYTLSVHGLTWTSTNYFKTVSSATVSGVAGVVTAGQDTLVVGVTNGVNNATTIASVSLPSSGREFITFAQVSAYIEEQGSATITAEYFLSAFKLAIDLQMKPDVTSRFGNRTDEPVKEGHVQVTGGLSFSKWTDANHELLKAQLSKGKYKVKVEFIGPLAATGYPFRLTLYLNNVQFTKGSVNIADAAKIPLDLEFKAHRALAVPTGFPAGYTGAVTAELVNLRTTAAI